MGLSRVVASVAVVPAALALTLYNTVSAPITIILSHVAATGVVIACAASDPVAAKTTSLLGKFEDGKIRYWGKILFWPYHLGLRVRLRIRKFKSREPLYDQIIPGWYVGGWPKDTSCLPPGNPSIIDCTCEYPKMHNSERYLCLLVWDSHGATVEQLRIATDWAQIQHKNGHPIYIHCAHGHGRSVAIMMACFLKLGMAKSMDVAESMIKSIRPKINVNRRQRKNLRAWMQTVNIEKE